MEATIELLEGHSLELMGIKAQGKYVASFIDTVDHWKDTLSRVDDTISEWTKV
jgi:dynein heavy chain